MQVPQASSRKDLWDWCKQRKQNERDGCPSGLCTDRQGPNKLEDVHSLEWGQMCLYRVPDSV